MSDAAPLSLSDGQPRRTDPKGLVMSALGMLRQLAVPLIAAGYGIGAKNFGFAGIAAIALVGLAGSIFFSWLGWRRRSFTLGTDDIRVESGIFSRAARSVPYERIQDVSLEQKLLARLLGLVEVRFETGAGGKDELTLAYVSRAVGEALREVVKERREGEAGILPGAAGERAAAEDAPLFAMDGRRIAIFGLFEFSLVIFAVLMGAAQQFDFLLPFEPWDWNSWLEFLSGNQDWLGGLGLAARAIAIALGLAAVVALGLASGLLKTFLREAGFRLDRTPKGFRRRRGLLTKTDVVMPAHRVQAAIIRTGLIRYRFGWEGLSFVSLAQDSAKSSDHVVAPFAREAEIWPIVRAAGLHAPAADTVWHRLSPQAFVDSAILASAIPVALALSISLGTQIWFVGAPILLAIPLIGLGQYLAWRRHRHALDAEQLYIGKGRLAPQLAIAPRVKLQSVEIAQGPLARRHGYATLHFGLAGGSLSLGGVALEDALALRDAVLDSIASVDFADLPR